MACLDDEAEVLPPPIVWNYHFVDDKDELISFHVLPIHWSGCERQDGKKGKIFLHGTVDNGLQKIHKQVIGWKFDLSYGHPEIFVLSKESNWLQLHKPRNSFADTVKSILVTLQCLHYVKRSPGASYESMRAHLSKVFGSADFRCFQNDLVDHIPLIRDSVKQDHALARSKFLVNFLEEKATKRKIADEDIQATKNPRFVVDHIEDDMIDDADCEFDDVDYLFNSVCAFCDDGGNLLGCEGRCLRSFHPTVESVLGSDCRSLGFTKDEVHAMPYFFCKNCKYKQHQCFACGKLGSSNKSSGAEVFPCVSPICGRFYHPRCVAELLYQDDGVSAEVLEKKIAIGERLICPIHKCCVCKKGEDRKDQELQFAVCMRCPKSYHRKCLPREIAIEKGHERQGEGTLIPRAWEGPLHNRILIYCTKHDIHPDGRTIIRDHIKFPDFEVNKISFEERKRKLRPEFRVKRDKVEFKKKELPLKELYKVTSAPATSKQKQKPSARKVGGTNRDYVLSGFDNRRKRAMHTASEKKVKTSMSEGNKISLLGREVSSCKSSGNRQSQKTLGHGENGGNETSQELLRGGKEKHRGKMGEISSKNKQDGVKLTANEKHKEMHPNSDLCDDSNEHSELSNGMQSAIVPSVPGLDQVDYPTPTAIISDCPPMLCRNSYDPREPQPGYLCGSIGFASGPNMSFSLQNSAGWLDE